MNFLKIGHLSVLLALPLFGACTRTLPEPAGTLHLPLSAKIKSLDPIQGNDYYSIVQTSYAYEGLLEYHYLKRPYALKPLLARELPSLAKDGRTYTFRLKEGVRFADDAAFGGQPRELTAGDFVYSWKRLADPKNTATGWWILDGRIAGLNEWRDAAAKSGHADYAAEIEGLRALDKYTLQVKARSPSPVFLYLLTTAPTFVVAREVVERYGPEIGRHPVGTGPYVLRESTATRLVWDRNPAYRDERYPAEGEEADRAAGLLADAGQPLPLSPRIVTEINEESLPSWLGFLAGKLDLSTVPKDSYASALPADGQLSPELAQKGIRVLEFPQMDLTRVSFNLADPLFAKNKLLRQALSLAYDAGPLIKTFYNGQAIPAEGPVPPGIPGYDPALKNPFRRFDLEKAKALLAKAGYPEGKGLPPLEFVNVASSSARQVGEYLERSFAPLGVKLKANAYAWPEYVKRVHNHEGQLWSFGWMPFYPDPENFLQLFYGKNFSPGPNDMSYANAEFDRLYEQSARELNPGRREGLVRRMVAILVADTPCIFGLHRTDHYLAQPWLRNVKLHNFMPAQAKFWRAENAARSR